MYINHHQVTPTLMSIQRLQLYRLECRTGLLFKEQQESRPWRNLTKFCNDILNPAKVTAYPSQIVKHPVFHKVQPSVKEVSNLNHHWTDTVYFLDKVAKSLFLKLQKSHTVDSSYNVKRHNFKADLKILNSSGEKPINWLWTLSE